MTGNRKKTTSLFCIFIAMVIFSIHGYSRINLNGSGTGYEDDNPPSGKTNIMSNQSIEDLIGQGAGYFLESKENFETLVSLVEMHEASAPASVSMQEYARDAVINIKNAVETYKMLVQQAESTPYRIDVIDTLKRFDYEQFGIENQLNTGALAEVTDFLANGDITGTYKKVSASCEQIESLLSAIKDTVDSGAVPAISQLDQLNELFSGTSLFGSYVARIFYNIDN